MITADQVEQAHFRCRRRLIRVARFLLRTNSGFDFGGLGICSGSERMIAAIRSLNSSTVSTRSRFTALASCLASVDTVNYFAGGSAASFWKAGSEGKGSQNGSSLRSVGGTGEP